MFGGKRGEGVIKYRERKGRRGERMVMICVWGCMCVYYIY